MNINTININLDNLQANITYLRNTYNYKYFIMDISNNAFNHGMFLVNNLSNIDFLYANNFNDILLVRKYNKDIPLIYSGPLSEDIIYDLIINNVIIILNNISLIKDLSIKDNLEFILNIDLYNYQSFNSKTAILDVLDLINTNNHLHLKGIISSLKEEDYEDFKYIISPLKDLDLICLNNEEDKNKIKLSNCLKLDYSIYGINKFKKTLFKKEEYPLKQIFSLQTKIINIKKVYNKKKEIIYGIIPMGFYNGLIPHISHVLINNNLYAIKEIKEEYSLITINESIHLNDDVIITSYENPLENYLSNNILSYFLLLTNLPITYNNQTLIY